MAQVSHHTWSWVGQGFSTGVEHGWEISPGALDAVVHVTAIPVTENTTELTVKNVRVRKNLGQRTWILLFTVRNTGPNNVPGYFVRFSIVRP